MRHPRPRPLRIKALQQNPLIRLHPAQVPPFLPLTTLHPRRLPRPVRIPMLNAHQVLSRHRSRIRHRQRERAHRPQQRPPHVDDPHPAREQLLCFGRQVVVHARNRRRRRLVDVGARHRFAAGAGAGAADGVVEDEDAVGGAGCFLEEELFDFRVVLGLYGLVVVEVGVRQAGGDVGEGGEAGGVEREGGGGVADVVDGNMLGVCAVVALGLAGGRGVDVVEWFGTVFGVFEED